MCGSQTISFNRPAAAEDQAVLIQRTPEPLLFARNTDDDFIKMPFVTEAA